MGYAVLDASLLGKSLGKNNPWNERNQGLSEGSDYFFLFDFPALL